MKAVLPQKPQIHCRNYISRARAVNQKDSVVSDNWTEIILQKKLIQLSKVSNLNGGVTGCCER